MKRTLFTLSALVLGTSLAMAAVPESCFVCQPQTNKEAFLKCIDQCLKVPLPVSNVNLDDKALMKKIEAQGWIVNIKKDEMTDAELIFVAKSSENAIQYITSNERPLLIFMKNQTKNVQGMLMDMRKIHLMPTLEKHPYTVRVDKNPAVSLGGDLIWQGTGIGFGDLSNDLLKQIRTGQTMLMRVETMGVGTHTLKWKLDGINDVLTLIYGQK